MEPVAAGLRRTERPRSAPAAAVANSSSGRTASLRYSPRGQQQEQRRCTYSFAVAGNRAIPHGAYAHVFRGLLDRGWKPTKWTPPAAAPARPPPGAGADAASVAPGTGSSAEAGGGSGRNVPEHQRVTLVWSISDVLPFRSLATHQIVNHVEGISALTTKVGLCAAVRQGAWTMREVGPDAFPVTYHLGDPTQQEEFQEMFRLRAAIAVLKWCSTASDSDRRLSYRRGVAVAYRVGQRLLHVCRTERLVGTLSNACTAEQWDELLSLSYRIVEERGRDLARDLPQDGGKCDGCESEIKEEESEEAAAEWRALHSTACRTLEDLKAVAHTVFPGRRAFSCPSIACCGSRVYQPILAEVLDTDTWGDSNVWVVKAPETARGVGVQLFYRLEDILARQNGMGGRVTQKYLEHPLLLPRRFGVPTQLKFDLRVLVLVTDWFPLKAYVLRYVYGKVCQTPYSLDVAHLGDKARHLCNFAVQKDEVATKANTPAREDTVRDVRDSADPTLFTFSELRAFVNSYASTVLCRGNHAGHADREKNTDARDVWKRCIAPEIDRQIRDALRAVQPSITPRARSFELVGFDVILDKLLQPYVLEANLHPSIAVRDGCEEHNRAMEHAIHGLLHLTVDRWVQSEPPAHLATRGGWSVLLPTKSDLVTTGTHGAGGRTSSMSGSLGGQQQLPAAHLTVQSTPLDPASLFASNDLMLWREAACSLQRWIRGRLAACQLVRNRERHASLRIQCAVRQRQSRQRRRRLLEHRAAIRVQTCARRWWAALLVWRMRRAIGARKWQRQWRYYRCRCWRRACWRERRAAERVCRSLRRWAVRRRHARRMVASVLWLRAARKRRALIPLQRRFRRLAARKRLLESNSAPVVSSAHTRSAAALRRVDVESDTEIDAAGGLGPRACDDGSSWSTARFSDEDVPAVTMGTVERKARLAGGDESLHADRYRFQRAHGKNQDSRGGCGGEMGFLQEFMNKWDPRAPSPSQGTGAIANENALAAVRDPVLLPEDVIQAFRDELRLAEEGNSTGEPRELHAFENRDASRQASQPAMIANDFRAPLYVSTSTVVAPATDAMLPPPLSPSYAGAESCGWWTSTTQATIVTETTGVGVADAEQLKSHTCPDSTAPQDVPVQRENGIGHDHVAQARSRPQSVPLQGCCQVVSRASSPRKQTHPLEHHPGVDGRMQESSADRLEPSDSASTISTSTGPRERLAQRRSLRRKRSSTKMKPQTKAKAMSRVKNKNKNKNKTEPKPRPRPRSSTGHRRPAYAASPMRRAWEVGLYSSHVSDYVPTHGVYGPEDWVAPTLYHGGGGSVVSGDPVLEHGLNPAPPQVTRSSFYDDNNEQKDRPPHDSAARGAPPPNPPPPTARRRTATKTLQRQQKGAQRRASRPRSRSRPTSAHAHTGHRPGGTTSFSNDAQNIPVDPLDAILAECGPEYTGSQGAVQLHQFVCI